MRRIKQATPEPAPSMFQGTSTDRRHPRARAALQRRIIDEFAEMRDHPVTPVQAARLFGLSPEVCRRILDELTRNGALRRRHGHYTFHSPRP